METATSEIRFGAARLDLAQRRLLIDEEPARLGARAFDVLVALVERRDRAVGKNELFELVWPGVVVEENNLQVHISALRKLLGPQTIATIPGAAIASPRALLDVDQRRPPRNFLELSQRRWQLRSHCMVGKRICRRSATCCTNTRRYQSLAPGGIGKTRLALVLSGDGARALCRRNLVGRAFAAERTRAVPAAIAQALGVHGGNDRPVMQTVVGTFAQRTFAVGPRQLRARAGRGR